MDNKQLLWKRLAWAYFILAALSLLVTINWPIMKEEYVYTSMLLDTALNHNWLQPHLFGSIYARTPMTRWLGMPFLKLFGPSHAIVATRALAFLSTLATAIWIIFFVKKLQPRDMVVLPILSGAIFLTGDVLLIRGWLAYADPTFAFFIFGAVSLLYLAMVRNSYPYFISSLVFIFLAFLTKEPTAYVFYLTAGFSLMISGVSRDFVSRYKTWVIGIFGIVLPYVAWRLTLHLFGEASASGDLLSQIVLPSWSHEFFKSKLGLVERLLIAYNLIFLISSLALFLSRNREKILPGNHLRTIMLIVLLSAAPYFILGGNSQPRYLLPVVPWVAIYIAQAVLRCRSRVIYSFFAACWLLLLVKYSFVLSGRMFVHGKLMPVHEFSLYPEAKFIAKLSKGDVCFYTGKVVRASIFEPPMILGAVDMQISVYGRLLKPYSTEKDCGYVLLQSPTKPHSGWHLVRHFTTVAIVHNKPYADFYFYRTK